MTGHHTPGNRRLAGIALSAFAVATAAACGNGSSTAPLPPISGTYNLVTISGQPVPAQYADANDSIVDDVYHVHSDGSYDRLGHQRMYISGQWRTLDDIDSGTVVRGRGAAITLKSRIHGTAQVPGSISGDVMTLAINPGPFVYNRDTSAPR